MNPTLYVENGNVMRTSPELAEEIGLNESIILLQLDFLIKISSDDNWIDGRKWTYQSVRDLQANYFPFWGKTTIHRALKSLLDKNLLLEANYNKKKYDKTRWLAINYEEVDKLESLAVRFPNDKPGGVGTRSFQNGTGSIQNGTGSIQNGTTIPETSTEISTDNNNTEAASQELENSIKEAAASQANNNVVVVSNIKNHKTTKTAPTQNIEVENTDVSGDNDKVQLLISYGVTKSKARDLAKNHNIDYIHQVIRHSASEARNNQGGYITKALEENWNFTKNKPPKKAPPQPPARPNPSHQKKEQDQQATATEDKVLEEKDPFDKIEKEKLICLTDSDTGDKYLAIPDALEGLKAMKAVVVDENNYIKFIGPKDSRFVRASIRPKKEQDQQQNQQATATGSNNSMKAKDFHDIKEILRHAEPGHRGATPGQAKVLESMRQPPRTKVRGLY